MQLKRIIDVIESFAPPGLALEWDRCGIQVAGTRQEINRLAVALDPDETTIQQAINLQADFLLTHHPLCIKPRLPDRRDSFFRILKGLLSADIILYSAHTSLDANPHGPAAWLARMLGLKNLSVLEPCFTRKALEISFQNPLALSSEDIPCSELLLSCSSNKEGLLTDVSIPADKADFFLRSLKSAVYPLNFITTEKPDLHLHFGLGFTGTLPEPVSFDKFTDNLKNILNVSYIIQSGNPPEMVSTVSCCPGSGGDLALKAFRSGAQVFITGDLKYHQAQEASGKGCVLDVGHFILEEKMMHDWYLTLKQQLKDIEVLFIKGRSPFQIL